ncbi:hypothetical protein [Halapricum desulfuricans]|uniref:Uncharacterized protein n=1 Tax=Halapricum desulfuricans TaxID=2841257 RepID=A0A897N5M5_9EURY|nr:hypothetical protein [Halapricum desulfuricans]QSG07568.1 Uncharacterized protein HSR122_0151 [Halapricum desulfuricans]
MKETEQTYIDSHLDFGLDLPPIEDIHLPNIYVALEIDLLAPGDGIVTDRHHASAERYEADDPMNQIEGQISPFTLSGWLRHGCEEVVKLAGASACHPGEPNADYMRAETYERDLENGYHEKGTCIDAHDPDHAHDHENLTGCVIYDLFGGFGADPGKLLRRPITFSPIRRHVDILDGEAEAHYRQVSTHVRSRNDADGGQPLRQTDQDVLGNLEGTWKLTLRELKPEFVGLLLEAVAFLDTHSDDFAFQIGGARNFGAGIADAQVINPLYTDQEIKRVFDRSKDATAAMQDKDETWRREYRDEFVRALQARTAMRDGDLPHPGLDGDGT